MTTLCTIVLDFLIPDGLADILGDVLAQVLLGYPHHQDGLFVSNDTNSGNRALKIKPHQRGDRLTGVSGDGFYLVGQEHGAVAPSARR